MAVKTIYCAGCRIKVGMLVEGSKTMIGMVSLCPACEGMRKASDLAAKTETRSQTGFDFMNDIFKGRAK